MLFLVSLLFFSNVANIYSELVVPDNKNVFDLNLYEEVLDPELCDEQISYLIQNDTELLLEYLDAGIRTPRGVLTGNLFDFGNYFQCLGINKDTPISNIEGKYCVVSVPLDQTIEFPSLPTLPEWPGWPNISWPESPGLNPPSVRIKPEVLETLTQYDSLRAGLQTFSGLDSSDRVAGTQLASLTLNVATCIPKTCSTQRVLRSSRNLEYSESFCRLPNDKPWVAGDYVAISVFSLILLLTALSTAYDIHYQKYSQADPKRINKLYQSFSVYTNTRRLVTYIPVPGALECLDGIRSFAMMWVILGHTFSNQLSAGLLANPVDTYRWIMSLSAVWITSAPITVDTFFMLSGLLLVYTTAGKFTGTKLLQNLHLFYLNRLLRIFPVLAAVVLMQVSLFNWVADGPYWGQVAAPQVHRCRVNWWTTLLHVQNLVNPGSMCLPHSWYVSIDTQLYIVSPLILYWVLGKSRKTAWAALLAALLAIMASTTAYNFIKEFPAGPVIPSRPDDYNSYMYEYYVFTFPRAPPFFVGMIVGYLLHLYRKIKIVINAFLLVILWVCAIVMIALVMYSTYPIVQMDWDNQTADSMMNSFMRPGWAMAVGWLIFACEQGYGGLINWILCLRMWKVLGRLSYAMYLVHYPMIFIINAMIVTPNYFSVKISIFKFLADFSLAALVAFLLAVLIEAPFSTLVKHFMGGGQRKPPVKATEPVGKEPIMDETKLRSPPDGVINVAYTSDVIKTQL